MACRRAGGLFRRPGPAERCRTGDAAARLAAREGGAPAWPGRRYATERARGAVGALPPCRRRACARAVPSIDRRPRCSKSGGLFRRARAARTETPLGPGSTRDCARTACRQPRPTRSRPSATSWRCVWTCGGRLRPRSADDGGRAAVVIERNAAPASRLRTNAPLFQRPGRRTAPTPLRLPVLRERDAAADAEHARSVKLSTRRPPLLAAVLFAAPLSRAASHASNGVHAPSASATPA